MADEHWVRFHVAQRGEFFLIGRVDCARSLAVFVLDCDATRRVARHTEPARLCQRRERPAILLGTFDEAKNTGPT
jgi:hypothetical protein